MRRREKKKRQQQYKLKQIVLFTTTKSNYHHNNKFSRSLLSKIIQSASSKRMEEKIVDFLLKQRGYVEIQSDESSMMMVGMHVHLIKRSVVRCRAIDVKKGGRKSCKGEMNKRKRTNPYCMEG